VVKPLETCRGTQKVLGHTDTCLDSQYFHKNWKWATRVEVMGLTGHCNRRKEKGESRDAHQRIGDRGARSEGVTGARPPARGGGPRR
jgi:hypothetical protein